MLLGYDGITRRTGGGDPQTGEDEQCCTIETCQEAQAKTTEEVPGLGAIGEIDEPTVLAKCQGPKKFIQSFIRGHLSLAGSCDEE